MSFRISNCYDSHTHFLATGQMALGLQLQGLQSAEDISQIQIQPEYMRGHWLIGFGWDQNKWSEVKFPSKQILDRVFPEIPVLLSRADGHASWLNSKALNELQSLGCVFQDTDKTLQSGILFEQDHLQALSLLPAYSDMQVQTILRESQNIFNQAGFTHIRDMSMNLQTWNCLLQLYQQKNLTVCLESFVTVEKLKNLEAVLSEFEQIKKLTCPQLRLSGVKLFVDGSLGSKTAYLSENYIGTESPGQLMWSYEELIEAFSRIWQKGHDIAVHCIGDQCAHLVVQAARQVSARGILGRLHFEHVEILRPETVQMMKPLHVTCYMQPCHWISDHSWLKDSISEKLHKNIFQWELLRKNKIPFFFGSDSPIEKPSLFANLKALQESAENKVPALQDDWKKHHSHPDSQWTNSWTEFDDQKILQVFFNGNPLL